MSTTLFSNEPIIVHGSASEEELAALAAVLATIAQQPRENLGRPRRRPSRWAHWAPGQDSRAGWGSVGPRTQHYY